MYAVIETGGKQYRVQIGDILQTESLDGAIGSPIEFDRVLFLSGSTPAEGHPQVILGKPYITQAKVIGQIVGQGRDEKILIVKMKRRKQYRRTQGHRQHQTQCLITEIQTNTSERILLSEEQRNHALKRFQSHLKLKEKKVAPSVSSAQQ